MAMKSQQFLLAFLAVIAVATGGTEALAQGDCPRLAYVLANSGYRAELGWDGGTSPIVQVLNGGQAVKELFEKAGFCTVFEQDLNLARMKEMFGVSQNGYLNQSRLKGDLEKGRGSEITIVYYGGHGFSRVKNGHTGVFLAPVDGKGDDVATAYDATNIIDTLTASGESFQRVSIIMLDTCRKGVPDVPVIANLQDGGRPAVTLGSAPRSPGAAVSNKLVILYSTYDLTAAFAGTSSDRYTWWTGAMLNQLLQPGMSLMEAVRRTEQEVRNRSNEAQLPVTYGSLSLLESVILFPAEGESTAWKAAQQQNTSAAYRQFIRAYPQSRHIEEAARLEAGLPDERPPGATAPVAGSPALTKPSAGYDNWATLAGPKRVQRALQVILASGAQAGGASGRNLANDIREFQTRLNHQDTGMLTPQEAVLLFSQAAATKATDAQVILGVLLASDPNSFENLKEADFLFREAMSKGSVAAIFNHGIILVAAPAASSDVVEGCNLLKVADSRGHPEAKTQFSKYCSSAAK